MRRVYLLSILVLLVFFAVSLLAGLATLLVAIAEVIMAATLLVTAAVEGSVFLLKSEEGTTIVSMKY